jgi:uncharacterized phage-associated protein
MHMSLEDNEMNNVAVKYNGVQGADDLGAALYSPGAVVNWFIEKAFSERVSFTPMKLQKLLYFSHGHFLGKTSIILIDEPAEAWPYGPVFPSVYHEFKKYGSSEIPITSSGFMRELTVLDNKVQYKILKIADKEYSSLVVPHLEEMWKRYSFFSAKELSDKTHEENSPWFQVWEMAKKLNMRSIDIDNTRIRNYFTQVD